ELMAASASLITTPETIVFLVRLGDDVNDKPDGGSTVLDTCLRNFGWRESVWDASYPYRHSIVPASRLGKSLDALRFLLDKGARWTPDDRAIGDTRRALYRVDAEAIAAVIELLRAHHACDDNTVASPMWRLRRRVPCSTSPSRPAAIGRRRRSDRSCPTGLRYRIGKDDAVLATANSLDSARAGPALRPAEDVSRAG